MQSLFALLVGFLSNMLHVFVFWNHQLCTHTTTHLLTHTFCYFYIVIYLYIITAYICICHPTFLRLFYTHTHTHINIFQYQFHLGKKFVWTQQILVKFSLLHVNVLVLVGCYSFLGLEFLLLFPVIFLVAVILVVILVVVLLLFYIKNVNSIFVN